MSASDPNFVLLELEERMLGVVDDMMEAYSNQTYMPKYVIEQLVKVHSAIFNRLRAHLGASFDAGEPEKALIQLDRIRGMLLKKIEQKAQMSGSN